MDRKFKRINMDDVKSIINQKGFYYFPLERVYDNFEGGKYIIVTDNPDHIKQNPQYADEIIMTTEQFEKGSLSILSIRKIMKRIQAYFRMIKILLRIK